MHRAVSASAGLDLRPFVGFLRSRAIAHHITEESGQLVVWARSQAEAELIAGLFAQWRQGTLDMPAPTDTNATAAPLFAARPVLQNMLAALWLAPVSVIAILACLLVAAVSGLGSDPSAVRGLFFPASGLVGIAESPVLFLRTLTPALLHFGAVHLVFNLLWLWYFGRMIEPVLPWWSYLLLLTLTAFTGNVAQYVWSGHGMFGGMSGVVYGLVGFIWMWQTLKPHSTLQLPKPMIMVFLAALVLMEVLASSMIASAAHVGGLLGGMGAGVIYALLFKR